MVALIINNNYLHFISVGIFHGTIVCSKTMRGHFLYCLKSSKRPAKYRANWTLLRFTFSATYWKAVAVYSALVSFALGKTRESLWFDCPDTGTLVIENKFGYYGGQIWDLTAYWS
jgi:hypothetical protein